MYVTKVMYNLKPMGDYGVQDVVNDCINHYLNGLDTINKLQGSAEYPIDEKTLFDKYYGKKISFNTDLLQLEIVISSTDIIRDYKSVILKINKQRLENGGRLDPHLMDDEELEDDEKIFMLDQQILACTSFNGLQIKIFKLNNKDYYCYSL